MSSPRDDSDMSQRPELDVSVPTVGIAAVLCSVVGLQIGGLTTGLLDDRVPVAVALSLGIFAVVLGGAVGFWVGSMRPGIDD